VDFLAVELGQAVLAVARLDHLIPGAAQRDTDHLPERGGVIDD
jgi:hypothetical protein